MDQDANNDDAENYIKPSSSSMMRAPSWSSGSGANPREAANKIDSRLGRDGAQGSSSGSYQDAPSSTLTTNSLKTTIMPSWPTMTIEIPTVYLTREDPSISSFHVYQVKIKSDHHSNVEWSIYRRYSQFHTLHHQLRSLEPAIKKLSFPPKRRLNSKASTIVQDRRRRLEEYIRRVAEHIRNLPLSSAASESSENINKLLTEGPVGAQQVAVDLDEVGSLNQEAAQSEHDEQEPDQSDATDDDTNGSIDKKPSVRMLFYNFISPDSPENTITL